MGYWYLVLVPALKPLVYGFLWCHPGVVSFGVVHTDPCGVMLAHICVCYFLSNALISIFTTPICKTCCCLGTECVVLVILTPCPLECVVLVILTPCHLECVVLVILTPCPLGDLNSLPSRVCCASDLNSLPSW